MQCKHNAESREGQLTTRLQEKKNNQLEVTVMAAVITLAGKAVLAMLQCAYIEPLAGMTDTLFQ